MIVFPAEVFRLGLPGESMGMGRVRRDVGRRIFFNGRGNAGGGDGAANKLDAKAQKEERERQQRLEKEEREREKAIASAEKKVGHQGRWAD